MNKVLKSPIAPKEKKDGIYPWTYNAPTKDQAHSGYLCAGNKYGVGFRNPMGKEHCGSMESGPIPQKAHAFSPDEVFDGEDKKG
ncbi:MAG TPA: hypothetical protein DCP92_24730 [Nitrospiraceae bacterium]|jgi:hypothetical protein|nr:hypothetical protein [Nitrospiraceae bacterium]